MANKKGRNYSVSAFLRANPRPLVCIDKTTKDINSYCRFIRLGFVQHSLDKLFPRT
ncbi:Uncharacterised protein [Yersinia thracica]|uniref:Uncharacterized protein n=1 Tax=Yersinia thracica TaxID=2890319 RepID=A0A0T9NHN0_9GAMM|nr:Uncharacterised protein [Yersinia thracica]